MSDTIASPTPDEKNYDGTMSKEDYAKQPESNTGATVERDVDSPNPKTPADQVPLTDEEKERQRKHDEIMAAERNQPDGVPKVLAQDEVTPDDAQEKHAEAVSQKQRDKLNPNTPVNHKK